MRIYIIPLVFIITALNAQEQAERSVEAVWFSQPPTIDGHVTEDLWQLAQPIEGFIQFEPVNGMPSTLRTVVYVGYSSEALYVAFICYDPSPGGIAASLTKRDSDLRKDDAVVVMLDTYNDNRTCTVFSTNSIGTQWDYRVTDNGRTSNNNWDASWSSASVRIADGWSAEFAIPFTSLKFQAGENQSWGLNLGRSYPRQLEVCYWTGPLESEARVSQFGELTSLNPGSPAKRYEVIPYALSQAMEDQELEGQAGLDLRYRIGSNLGAELTVNPDFATIEADVERINLTRFELNYPEKRPFFLEGGELFQQRVRQFYSRRIGDIPWGAKLTGKIGSFDLALLSAQSLPLGIEPDGTDATYTVVRAQRGLFGPSSIGFLAANRHLGSDDQGSVGIDGTFFFTETLGMTTQFVRAHGPQNDGALTWFLRPSFDNATSHFHIRYSHWAEGLMENINAIGFIRDDNRKEFDTNVSHTFWITESAIERINARVNYNRYWSQAGSLRSWLLSANCGVIFASRWIIEFSFNDEFKGKDQRFEKDFRNRRTTLELGYDNRVGRSATVSYGIGRNFDSDIQLLQAQTSIKFTDAWNVGYDLTRLWLHPDPSDETTFIHVVRSTYYFNQDLFLKLFYQTHSALDKRNVQVVVVWRFLPPFGSLQVAYQRGASRVGTTSDQGHSLFIKLSWVL